MKCAGTPTEDVKVKGDTGGVATVDSTQVLVHDMSEPPSVTCDDEKCVPGTDPREVALSVAADGTARFELLGTRRTDVPEPPSTTTTTTTPTTTTTTTTPSPAPAKSTFIALGGNLPLQISGSSGISVTGDALFNRGSSGDVSISMGGNPRIDVSGVLGLETPGTCTGCDKFANQLPTGFDGAVEDPLGLLPAPDTAGMPVYKSCRTEGRQAVCSPGVYEGVFPSASGGVGDYTLEPGVYVLNQGLSMSWGSISGNGVMLYGANGAISIGGGSKVVLTPPTDGLYQGISLFQGRTGNASLAIAGNALLSTPGGTVYGATQHLALSGSATVEAARVITRSVAMSGNTKAVVGGA